MGTKKTFEAVHSKAAEIIARLKSSRLCTASNAFRALYLQGLAAQYKENWFGFGMWEGTREEFLMRYYCPEGCQDHISIEISPFKSISSVREFNEFCKKLFSASQLTGCDVKRSQNRRYFFIEIIEYISDKELEAIFPADAREIRRLFGNKDGHIKRSILIRISKTGKMKSKR